MDVFNGQVPRHGIDSTYWENFHLSQYHMCFDEISQEFYWIYSTVTGEFFPVDWIYQGGISELGQAASPTPIFWPHFYDPSYPYTDYDIEQGGRCMAFNFNGSGGYAAYNSKFYRSYSFYWGLYYGYIESFDVSNPLDYTSSYVSQKQSLILSALGILCRSGERGDLLEGAK